MSGKRKILAAGTKFAIVQFAVVRKEEKTDSDG